MSDQLDQKQEDKDLGVEVLTPKERLERLVQHIAAPNQLSDEQVVVLVRQKQSARLALKTAEKQLSDHQGISATSLVALKEERDRLWTVFFDLKRRVDDL